MNVAQIKISYDRGVAQNRPTDLRLNELPPEEKTEGEETKPKIQTFGKGSTVGDGKVIRGLGTHFRSKRDAELVKLRDAESKRIYNQFRARFVATPLDGVYVIPAEGDGKKFQEEITSDVNCRVDVTVRVTEYKLESPRGLDAEELAEWSTRVKNQLKSISLGRKKDVDEEGLQALELLAKCPIIKKGTQTRIKEMVGLVRINKMTRLELKRSIETMRVGIEAEPLSPRRAPVVV